MAVVASLGVEPRWASPVDFESTASTSSATRPSDPPACASRCRASLGASTIPQTYMKFCPACGQPVEMRVPPGDNLPRAVCTACGSIHYENPRMVVGCVPEWQGRILLCQRAIEPRRGYWTTPAGFMENGETLQGAAARESLEEAQASVQVGSLLSITHVLHAAQVHVTFRARLLDGQFGAGVESQEV